MTNLKKVVAFSAAMTLVSFGGYTLAQDDLDSLLMDLESSEDSAVTKPADPSPDAEAESSAEAAEPEPETADAEEPAPEVAEAEPESEPAAEPEVEEPAPEVAAAEPKPEPAAEPEAEEPAPEVATAEPEPEPAAEPEAEEPAPEVAAAEPEPEPAAEPEAEEPAPEVAAAEPEPEPAAEPEAEEPAPEVAAAEEPAPAPAEEPEASDPVLNTIAETEGEVPVAPAPEPTAAAAEPAPAAPAAAEVAAAPAPEKTSPEYTGKDAELIEYIRTTEELRRNAFDIQAKREYGQAEQCMAAGEYKEAAKHYRIAEKLLNDSPKMSTLRTQCQQGVAEALYKAAMLEDETGLRDKAIKLMKKAKECRHPKARRQLEIWLNEADPDAEDADVLAISHRRNDEDYKKTREKNLVHLRRSRQLLATRDLDRALDECELVLLSEPYNQEAIRLRNKIEKKRNTILLQEHTATRDGMIADVERAWRPVYAVDAREVDRTHTETVKAALGDDPERRQEQDIVKRMKEMRLPAISFKPPATIIDAVDFFRNASKDYDRPDIPLEQRGFNFVLKTPETLRTAATAEGEESEGFGDTEEPQEGAGGAAGVPMIPMITASDITFFEALKLVCESVDYKFKVQGPIVMVMHKDMSTDEMVTRSYPVVSAFMDRMDSASSDVEELKSSGFTASRNSGNDDEENKERNWKKFFELLGVKWPEGSQIYYIKTIGKLRVKNTYENLAELEKALTEMNADPKLIEIETRFVEVCQEDLNSLGFEWILNSDTTLNLGQQVSRALGIKRGMWQAGSNTTPTYSTTYTTSGTGSGSETIGGTSSEGLPQPSQTSTYGGNTVDSVTYSQYSSVIGGDARSSGATWVRDTSNPKYPGNIGINSFGGESEYQTGQRYLSTMSNHISGESKSTNDQFMRVNAFIGGMDLSMILHMLSQRSDTDLLSAPKVLTRPGQPAVIKVVTEYIYPTDYDVQLQSSSSSSGSYGGSQSAILAVVEPQSFTMRPVGVMLNVTPTLTDDGNLIDLELQAEVVDEPTWKNYGMRIPFTGNSSLQSFAGLGEIFTGLATVLQSIGTGLSDAMKAAFAEKAVNSATAALDALTMSGSDNITYYDAPMEQPFFHVRSVESNLSIYPGATIVMGGLITEQRKAMDDKIPFLGDLPFIGRLFRSHSEQTIKRNLLIFVTTRLVDVRGREVKMGSLEEKSDNVTAAPEEEDED